MTLLLDPRASFWYAPPEATQELPLVRDLESSGLKSGQTLRIDYQMVDPGYSDFNCGGPYLTTPSRNFLWGIFSDSGEILAQTTPDRVPGAIDVGIRNITAPSPNGGPTDVPYDFPISSAGFRLITIPPGAKFLILGGGEWDNCVPGNISPYFPHGAVNVTIKVQNSCQ